jgi:RIO kinase 1
MYHQNFDNFDNLEGLDALEEIDDLIPVRGNGRKQHRRKQATNPQHEPKKDLAELYAELADSDEDQAAFIQTYQPSRHERQWILDSLGGFYRQRWIRDVLRLVKGGKEASVYLCEGDDSAPQPLLAAKVYRPRMFRNLRNDHAYREGRPELNADGHQIFKENEVKAMQQRSNYGRDLLHSSWISYELASMQTLHAAGADIPEPLGRSNNAILMEYIGAPDFPAPILETVTLEPEEVQPLFEQVVANIRLMLAHDLIHGDLSAYNILYWQGEITLIDFPQVVSPGQNRNAFRIFERDVVRVCEYFAGQGLARDGRELARQLWREHGLRTGPEVPLDLLDDSDEDDYRYWQQYGQA